MDRSYAALQPRADFWAFPRKGYELRLLQHNWLPSLTGIYINFCNLDPVAGVDLDEDLRRSDVSVRSLPRSRARID